MAQPIKKGGKDGKNLYSSEIQYILDHIRTTTFKDYHFKEITPSIFVIGALECDDLSIMYKVLNMPLDSKEIASIYDVFAVEQMNKTKNNEGVVYQFKDDYIPPISEELDELFKLSIEEVVVPLGFPLLTSDNVLCTILKYEKYISNEAIEKFKDLDVNYKIFRELMIQFHEVINISGTLGKKTTKKNTEITKTEDLPVITTNNPEVRFYFTGTDGLDSLGNKAAEFFKNFMYQTADESKKNITKEGKANRKSEIPYCTNLNQLAKNNKLEKLIGRGDVLKKIYTSIGRKKVNNAIIVGDSGVGKTQIIYGIVEDIVNNTAPYMFKDKVIYKLNPGEIVAGTIYRGMLEERLSTIVKSLKENKNAILFIDGIEVMFNQKEKNDFNSGGNLTQLLTDGDVQVIATTTYKGYKTVHDENRDIISKFQKIDISEMSTKESIEIIRAIKGYYEDFHCVSYGKKIIEECVELSKKYITEKKLPSSAIEILDELGSYTKLNSDRAREMTEYSSKIKELQQKKDKAIRKDDMKVVDSCDNEIGQIKVSLSLLEEGIRKKVKIETTLDGLYKVISMHTGIPIGKVQASEKETLRNIKPTLMKHIIGQDEAIDVVTRAIKRNKIGLNEHKRPILNALFLGATGTGKTLLAKELAKEIFGDEKYLIRFDMSEYNDKTSVNKLIGASAGYTGYDEGGLLTQAVKNNKYAVLLLDEIEKADDSVYNLFLQIMDEGFLTDNKGDKVDFRNTMVILTSNVGAKEANRYKALGFDKEYEAENKKEIIRKELKNKFPPEFINRLDEVVYFNNLSEENIKQIIEIELGKTKNKLFKIGHDLKYSSSVVDFIHDAIEKDKEYGARPIMRAIKDNIENKITDMLIDNEYNNKHIFDVDCENNEIIVK